MDGVINLYKEEGITSFKAVNALRKELGVKKAGHTGTLDPDATGVLPVCLGKATKLVELLMGSDKKYRAEMLLGRSTTTQDVSGDVIEELDRDEVVSRLAGGGCFEGEELYAACKKNIEAAFRKFTGEIMQVPPMYSALKVNGVKLVDAARKGEHIDRKPRKVTIFEYEDICIHEDLIHVTFSVRCSKGTYIRTLCEDIGKELGVPACMEKLERTEASGLCADDSLRLSELAELNRNGRIEETVIPIDHFLLGYEAVVVKDEAVKKILVGNFICDDDIERCDGAGGRDEAAAAVEVSAARYLPSCQTAGCFRIYDKAGRFYALYRYDENKKLLRPQTMFI